MTKKKPKAKKRKFPKRYLGCADTLPPNDKRHDKFAEQRKTRGFDDTELWSLDVTIYKFALPRLIVFKTKVTGIGHPIPLTQVQWNDYLEDMVYALDQVVHWEDIYGKRTQRGLRLFHKYFSYLWY